MWVFEPPDFNASVCCLYQGTLMMRWRGSFPSTYSLVQAPVLEPHLFPPPAVVPVHPPLMENLQPPAGLVVDNRPDHHKVKAGVNEYGVQRTASGVQFY